MSACATKDDSKSDRDAVDTDTAKTPGYTALGDSATAADSLAAEADAKARMAKLIEQFPSQYLIDDSFETHDSAYLGINGLNDVLTAQYVIDGIQVVLFVTEDRSGAKYLLLTEFATTQSQVRPAPMPFDAGYSVLFNHLRAGRVLSGLKAGYLVGMVGYRDSMAEFTDRWISAIG
ncbi:hypothetical protein GF377_06910 [candidate division GN15 bacterium]|nr:hypothetical protein [candidate division GN15 bacterium]